MNRQSLSTLIFAIIFLGNLVLAIWSLYQQNYTEAMISGAIVMLIITWFLLARKEQ